MEIGGSPESLSAKLNTETVLKFLSVEHNLINISYKDDAGDLIRLSGQGKDLLRGKGKWEMAIGFLFMLKEKKHLKKKKKERK